MRPGHDGEEKKVGENMEKIIMKTSLPVVRPRPKTVPKFFVPIIFLALQQG